jgi:hypothetical protein
MVNDGDRKSRNPAVQQGEQDTSIALSSLVLEMAPLLLIIDRRQEGERPNILLLPLVIN